MNNKKASREVGLEQEQRLGDTGGNTKTTILCGDYDGM